MRCGIDVFDSSDHFRLSDMSKNNVRKKTFFLFKQGG